jgi:hypothetical protein
MWSSIKSKLSEKEIHGNKNSVPYFTVNENHRKNEN